MLQNSQLELLGRGLFDVMCIKYNYIRLTLPHDVVRELTQCVTCVLGWKRKYYGGGLPSPIGGQSPRKKSRTR